MWTRSLLVAVALLAYGCGDEKVRPARSGAPAGSISTGGSGGASAEGGAGASSGKSGSGAAAGSSATDLPNCDALCVWEASVAGDCPNDATEQCQAAFHLLSPDDASCLSTLEAWCQCLHEHTDASNVSCTQGAASSNIPVINGMPVLCKDETDAWNECNALPDAG